MSSLEDSVRLAVMSSHVNDIKESVEDVRDTLTRRIRVEEKTSVQYTILIAKMAERERQEDMKGLAKSLEYLSDRDHNHPLGQHLGMLSEQLDKRGEIILAYVVATKILITDRNVYSGFVEHDGVRFGKWCLCPLYTFECPLTLDSAQILTYNNFRSLDVVEKKKLEAVIRTIPGAYKNGAWSQCDGFFGLYLNHEKKMISQCPPVLE